jgi:hypothetical protein
VQFPLEIAYNIPRDHIGTIKLVSIFAVSFDIIGKRYRLKGRDNLYAKSLVGG